jgi:hypothetical protein
MNIRDSRRPEDEPRRSSAAKRGRRRWFSYDPEVHEVDPPRLSRDPSATGAPGYPPWLHGAGGEPHEWDHLPEWQPPSAYEQDLQQQHRESLPPDFSGPDFRGPDFRGIGPKDYKRPDERILEEVNDRLTDAHDIDASDIECTIINGEVTLRGTVPDRNTKYKAEEVAERVKGVTYVQNDLRVQHRADAAREHSAFMDLGWLHGVND